MTRIKPNSIIFLFLVILSTTIVSLGPPMTPDALIAGSDQWPVGTFVVKVNGDASPSQFIIKIVSPGGGAATPESFTDDGTGTPVTLSGGGTFEMAPNTEPGYTRSLGSDCVNAFSTPSLPQRFGCTITFTQIGLTEQPTSSAPAPAPASTEGGAEELPLAEQMPQMSTPSPLPTPPASVSESLPPSPPQKPGTGVCDNNGNGLLDTEEQGCVAQLCATDTGKLVLADPSICDRVPRQQLPQPGSTTAQPQTAPPSPFTGAQPQTAPPDNQPGDTSIQSSSSSSPSASSDSAPNPTSGLRQPGEHTTEGTGNPTTTESLYEPPAAALPYHGNEVGLIEFYANADPTNPAILRTDKVGEDVHTTFADGTIKASKPVDTPTEEVSASDLQKLFVEVDIRITPGADTPLDRLGVIQARVPFSYSLFGPSTDHTIKYSTGDTIERRFVYPNLKVVNIEHKDSKGNILETTKIDYQKATTVTEKPDGSTSKYNADGSYITTWPKKADGSQQFYDSKQQKLFARDANENIIPPKE